MNLIPEWSIILFSFTFCIDAESTERLLMPSRSQVELELLDDSTCADCWAAYGITSLLEGRSDWCYYALEMGDRYSESSEYLHRVRASFEWLRGNREAALEQLAVLPEGAEGNLMRIACLQENGMTDLSGQLLEEIDTDELFYADAVEFLTVRQCRLTGNTTTAAAHMLDMLNRMDMHPLIHDAVCLEAFLHYNRNTSPEVLLKCLYSGIAVFGGVHIPPLLKMLEETHPSDPQTLVLVCELLCILDRKVEAAQLLSSLPDSVISGYLEIRLTEILIDLDRLDGAMRLVERMLSENPVNSQALELRGTLLLLGGNYEQAYSEMGNAAIETGSVQCTALQGLSAELAGYQKLAFEKYAEVLRLDPDSIVLINRNREAVSGANPLELIREPSTEPFSSHSYSGFSGGLGFSYFDNAGEYENRYVSADTDLMYRYGLYGSNISGRFRYSLNRWSDSEESSTMTASLAGQNFSSRGFYQELMIDWERRKYSQDRNRYEATLGSGYLMEPLQYLQVTSFLGLGRSEETVDSENNASWITIHELGLTLRGDAVGRVVPRLTLSGESVTNIDIRTGYELSLSAKLSLNAGGPFTISVGYDTSQSFQKALNYYTANRNTSISLNIDIN